MIFFRVANRVCSSKQMLVMSGSYHKVLNTFVLMLYSINPSVQSKNSFPWLSPVIRFILLEKVMVESLEAMAKFSTEDPLNLFNPSRVPIQINPSSSWCRLSTETCESPDDVFNCLNFKSSAALMFIVREKNTSRVQKIYFKIRRFKWLTILQI